MTDFTPAENEAILTEMIRRHNLYEDLATERDALRRQVLACAEALRWATKHIRLPNGADPEEFARSYNMILALIKQVDPDNPKN